MGGVMRYCRCASQRDDVRDVHAAAVAASQMLKAGPIGARHALALSDTRRRPHSFMLWVHCASIGETVPTPLDRWNVSRVKNAGNMFKDTAAFDQAHETTTTRYIFHPRGGFRVFGVFLGHLRDGCQS